MFLRVRSPSSVNYKLKCSAAVSTEHGTNQGPFTNTVRTPTDKSGWEMTISPISMRQNCSISFSADPGGAKTKQKCGDNYDV